jgi:TrmH family RNA methyltransferase
METVASRKNPLVLLARRVADGDPQERGRMLLDGLHLVQEARAAGLAVQTAAFSTRVLTGPDDEVRKLATSLGNVGCRVVQVSDAVMDALSPVSSPSGIVALATRPRHELSALLPAPSQAAGTQGSLGLQDSVDASGSQRSPRGGPLLCVVVDVQDPGNLGAIVRVAEAGGAAGVIVCGASADPFGWKALRGAMGSAFRVPIVRETNARDVVDALKQAGVRVMATAPADRARASAPGAASFAAHGVVQGATHVVTAGAAPAYASGSFYDQPLTGACAIVLGGEGPGLPAEVIAAADGLLSIPMQPPVESLNVAVSAAVIIYEARRQRLAAGARMVRALA